VEPSRLTRMALEVELGLSSRFSNSFYENNFHASLAHLSITSKVGVSSILPDAFDGSRCLHWRAGAGCVSLHEIWVNQDIDDNALVLRLGDENTGAPIAVSIDSEPNRNTGNDSPIGTDTDAGGCVTGINVSLRFLMKNGTIVRLQLSSSHPTLSVLAHIVEFTQGDLLDCTAAAGVAVAAGKAWASCYTITQCDSPAFGVFSGGDSCIIATTGTLLTSIQLSYQSVGANGGVHVRGTESTLSLTASDNSNVLNRLWGLVQGVGNNYSNNTTQPTLLACAHLSAGSSGTASAAAVAVAVVDTSGMLRIWDTKACVVQTNMHSLLSELLPTSGGILSADDAILSSLTNSVGERDIVCGLRCRMNIGDTGGHFIWHTLHLRFNADWACIHTSSVDSSSVTGGGSSASLIALQPLWAPAPIATPGGEGEREGGAEFVIASQWVHADTGHMTHVLTTQDGRNVVVSAPHAKQRHMMAAEDSRLSHMADQRGGWGNSNGSSSDLQSMQAARILRLFAPGRFSVRLVLATLVLDVPVPVSIPDISTVPVAVAAELVQKACGEWVQKILEEENADNSWNTSARADAMREDVEIEDNMRYCETLDCVLLDFTRLCHLRATRETERSARSCYLVSQNGHNCAPSLITMVAHPDSISLVLAAPEIEQAPASRTVIAHTKLRAQALKMIQDALHPAAMAEFWLSLEMRLQETATADAPLLQWMTARMEEVTTECQHLAPGLQSLLGCVTHDNDFFDNLLVIFGELRLPASGRVVTIGSEYADLTENDQYNTAGSSASSAYTTALAAGLALAVIREQAQESLLLAVLTALLAGPAVQATLTLWSRYTTPALLDVAYAGMLQFLSLVRAQDVTDMRRLVDVQDLCPNSHELSAGSQNGSAGTGPATSLTGWEKSSYSALHGLWAYGGLGGHLLGLSPGNALLDLDVRRAASRCAIAARPSITGVLMTYLASEGQFASMQKLASLLLLRLEVYRETTVALAIPDDDDDYIGARGANELAEVLLTSRARSLISVGSFYSSLRALTPYARRGIAPSPSQEHAVKSAVDAMLAAAPNRKANQNAEHWQNMIVSAPTEHHNSRTHNAADSAQRIAEKKRYFRDDLGEWQQSMLAALGPSSSSSSDEVTSSPSSTSASSISMEADAIRCCADTLARVVTENESMIAIARLHTGVHPTQKMSHMLVEYSSYLQHVAAISHAKDSLEVVKRARAVLGPELGAEMCLQAAYAGLEATKFALEGCVDFLDAHEWIKTYHFDDYRTAWSRVLNFALDGGRLDEALTAVCSILELDWDPAVFTDADKADKSNSGAGLTKPWEVSLRSVVALACESGRLNWLCALPETIIHGISITDSVAAALTRLAESRSLQPLRDGEVCVCYYECLFAFYCSRKSYRQGAGALRGMATRIAADAAAASTPHGSNSALASAAALQAQALAGCVAALAVVPSAQAFLLLPTASAAPEPAANNAISTGGASAGLEMLPRTSLVVDLLVNTAKDLYLESCTDTRTFNALDTVAALCEFKSEGPSLLAVNIAWHAVQLAYAAHPLVLRHHGSGSAAKEALLQAVSALALSCASPSQQYSEECPTLVEPYPAQITPITGATPDFNATNGAIYEPLLDVLRTLDSSQDGYALQTHALEVLLTTYPSEAPPAALLAPLNHHATSPSASVSTTAHSHTKHASHGSHASTAAAGKAKSTNALLPVSFGAGSDSATAIRKLIASGRLADACALAKTALSGPYPGVMGASASKAASTWTPYALIDKVILTARSALRPGSFKPQGAKDEDDVCQLKRALEGLEHELDAHFAQQCH